LYFVVVAAVVAEERMFFLDPLCLLLKQKRCY
jgi:hypothetical protein